MAFHLSPLPRTHAFRRNHPLVGRVPEQTFLREEFAAARAGQGRFVLVSGEAGIGKTTLVQDLVGEARTRDANILQAHCYDLTNTPPYGPWSDLFASLPAEPGIPQCPAPFASGSTPRVSDQSALFGTVRHFFDDLARGGPALVLCEDLHWADPASLELLRHVARSTARWPILLIATYRVDELTRAQPLYRLLPSLVREADAYRLELRRLVPNDLRELVSNLYHLPPNDEKRLVLHLAQRAEGNPFFTAELLRAMEEYGYLQRDQAGWTLATLDDLPLPSFVRQVIEERAARLGSDIQEALAMAAVIGHEVPLPLWQRVSGLSDLDLMDVVEQAVERQLLVASPDGSRVQFVHALTREALYESVTPPRRRLWHERAATVLMETDHSDPDAVAFHLQHAGDARAGEWLVRAADRAQRAYAWLTAADRLRSAADLLGSIPSEEDRRCRLLYRLARLKRFSLPADALAIADEAADLVKHLDDPVLAGDILFTQGVILCYANQFRAGLAALRAAAESLESTPLETARYYATSGPWLADVPPELALGTVADEGEMPTPLTASVLRTRWAAYHWMSACTNRPADTAAEGERHLAALSSGELSAGLRFSTAYTYHALAIAYAALARPDDAQSAWQASRSIYAEFDHHALHALALLAELRDVTLTFDADDPAARHALAAETEATIDRAGGAFRPGVSARLAWLGCFVLDGRWTEADQILTDLPAPGNAFLEREVATAIAELAWYRGEPSLAWEQIATSIPDGPATPPGNRILQEGLFLQRLAAHLALDASDLPAAHAWLSAHDAWLAWSGVRLGQAAGGLVWSRYHLANGEHARARSEAETALKRASDPAQPLVQLAANRQLGELDFVEGSLVAAAKHVNEAITLAERCEAPYELGQSLHILARVHHAQGDTEAAIRAARRAHAVLAPLGDSVALHRSLALLEELGASLDEAGCASSLRLTRRELDVLRLLVAHKTDREIADDLFLGHRTIHTHVTHILNKLGVANRREAAREAERRGLV